MAPFGPKTMRDRATEPLFLDAGDMVTTGPRHRSR